MDRDEQLAQRAVTRKKLAATMALLLLFVLPYLIVSKLKAPETKIAPTLRTLDKPAIRSTTPAETNSGMIASAFANVAASRRDISLPADQALNSAPSSAPAVARAITPIVMYSGASLSSSSSSSQAIVIAVPTWTDLLWSLPSSDTGAYTQRLEDLPIYPSARPTGTPIGKDRRSVLEYRQYSVSGNCTQVLDFYDRTLQGAGWTTTAVEGNDTGPLGQDRVDKAESAQASSSDTQASPSTAQSHSGRRSYYWKDTAGTSQYSLSLTVDATEYQPGSVIVNVVLQKEPDLGNLPVYPGASDVNSRIEE